MAELNTQSKSLKQVITDRFSSAAKSYHSSALMQKKSALTLLNLLKNLQNKILQFPILEIGCGSGFLTQTLINLFPNHPLIISDISSEMLAVCLNKTNLQNHTNLNFTVLDGEKPLPAEHYALIISGLTFQWFQNLEKSVTQLINSLRPQGCLVFSFLADGTFPEWQNICQKTGIKYSANQLPNAEKFAQFLSTLQVDFQMQEEFIEQTFYSAQHFFQNFKQTGASTLVKQPSMSFKELKSLCRYWNQVSSQKIKNTYKIAYFTISKK